MACGEQDGLVERFEATRTFLKELFGHWRLGTSYSGWVKAQTRECDRLVQTLKSAYRAKMIDLNQYYTGEWVVFCVDGSKLACPRTVEMQKHMGGLGKPNGIPQMSLTMIMHLGTKLPWDFRLGPGTESERSHVYAMVDDLPTGSLLVADAGFVGYDFCLSLINGQQPFLLRVGTGTTLYKELEGSAENEDLVYLWPRDCERAGRPPIKLRLLIIHDVAKQPIYLVTSVLEAHRLSDEDMFEIYDGRWGIEVEYRDFKQTMGHYKVLSKTPETAYVEAAWALMGTWLLQLVTKRTISAHNEDPQRSSTAKARNLVRRVLRHQANICKQRSFVVALAQCLVDAYQRHTPKRTRPYPQKRKRKPPGPPKIDVLSKAQVKKYKGLIPIQLVV